MDKGIPGQPHKDYQGATLQTALTWIQATDASEKQSLDWNIVETIQSRLCSTHVSDLFAFRAYL